MTPTTLVIDRTFLGVGRIKRATGTTIPAVRRRMGHMLTDLYENGRLDILRSVRDGDVSLMEVYHAFQRHELDTLPSAGTVKPLATAMKEWIASLVVPTDVSQKYKEALETSRRYFERQAPKATIADIPRVLEQLRATLGAKHPRSFNMARASVSSFVRSTLKRSHPIYLAIQAVEVRKAPKVAKRSPLSREQMRNFFPAPETDILDAIAWGMATTGMGPGEYWGDWSVLADRIHIGGTKRPSRVRDVPLVRIPAVPTIHRQTFGRWLATRTAERISPYDFRRTFANWMEAASVPRTRRKLYMGHKSGDVTDLYERHEVEAFLKEDAAKFSAFLGIEHTKPHTMALLKATGAND